MIRKPAAERTPWKTKSRSWPIAGLLRIRHLINKMPTDKEKLVALYKELSASTRTSRNLWRQPSARPTRDPRPRP